MNIHQFKVLIIVATATSSLLVASPALQKLVVSPQTESLTELSLLSAYHNATIPAVIAKDMTNRIYIDITNHLGSAAFYQIQIKFANLTQSGPDSFNKTSSSQPPIGTMSLVVANEGSLELPIDMSFDAYLDRNIDGLLRMQSIIINGAALNADTTTIRWDTSRNGFYGNLIFELWIYNDTINAFQYDQRYVNSWLKFYVS